MAKILMTTILGAESWRRQHWIVIFNFFAMTTLCCHLYSTYFFHMVSWRLDTFLQFGCFGFDTLDQNTWYSVSCDPWSRHAILWVYGQTCNFHIYVAPRSRAAEMPPRNLCNKLCQPILWYKQVKFHFNFLFFLFCTLSIFNNKMWMHTPIELKLDIHAYRAYYSASL